MLDRQMNSFEKVTVGEFKRDLENFSNDLPLIYSKDDEGNEFKKVHQLPRIFIAEHSDSYRFLVEKTRMSAIQGKTVKSVCVNGGPTWSGGVVTVGRLKKALAKYDDTLPLVYSHDAEGNEYQYVLYGPSQNFIKKQDSPRFLEIKDSKKSGTEECVCIN
jgi:hypothetical protein